MMNLYSRDIYVKIITYKMNHDFVAQRRSDEDEENFYEIKKN